MRDAQGPFPTSWRVSLGLELEVHGTKGHGEPAPASQHARTHPGHTCPQGLERKTRRFLPTKGKDSGRGATSAWIFFT